MRTAIPLAITLTVLSFTAHAATPETIGSWVLFCPAENTVSGTCEMHLQKPFFNKAGVIGDLRVQALGSSLVPVIALTGELTEVKIAAGPDAKTEATVQFADSPRQTLLCSFANAGYLCAPKDDAAAKLAAGLPSARSVTLRVAISVGATKSLSIEEKTVDLSGTNEALARLRILGPSPLTGYETAAAKPPTSGMMGLTDKALRAAGYPNGLADLDALVTRYKNILK